MRCLSASTPEIFRRADALFKNVDKLKQLALVWYYSNEEDSQRSKIEESISDHAGVVLSSLTEYRVRKICGEALYGAGLQNFMQGRVKNKKFWGNTLSGRLDEGGRKWLSSSDTQFFDTTITLESSSKRPRISGGCGCSLAKEGSICTHVAALMIAWVRKPKDFAEEPDYKTMKSEFDKVIQQIVNSLKELTDCIGNSSTRTDDLRLLQKIYSKLWFWAEDLREASRQSTVNHGKEMIREFSKTTNTVSFEIMAAFENKYNVEAINLYNKSTTSAFARMLELFVENDDSVKPTSSITKPKEGRNKETKLARVATRTGRSWDSLVERFRGR